MRVRMQVLPLNCLYHNISCVYVYTCFSIECDLTFYCIYTVNAVCNDYILRMFHFSDVLRLKIYFLKRIRLRFPDEKIVAASVTYVENRLNFSEKILSRFRQTTPSYR